MKISLTFPAYIVDAQTGREDSPTESLADFAVQHDDLATFFDSEIADQGVIGGKVRIVFHHRKPYVEVNYWVHETPSTELVEAVQSDTVAQLEDGVGESGFEFQTSGRRWLVIAETNTSCEVNVMDCGQMIPAPPEIAIAARDGNVSRLATLLAKTPADINRQHQGGTALHLAISFGHSDAVAMLLVGGANPNELDLQGQTPLHVCALANSLSDEESREIALLILKAGGNRDCRTPEGETPKSFAEVRGKSLLASIL